MTNFTKGEWTIQSLPHDYDFRKGYAYCIRDKRNCALAEVGHIDAIFDGEETEANASLIAAAPDMYEALKATRISLMADEHYQEFKPLLKTIEHALAKAENK